MKLPDQEVNDKIKEFYTFFDVSSECEKKRLNELP